MPKNIAVGEILEVLSAAKEAVRNTYRQNDTITYVISIVNAGTLAYTGLTITDNLGAYPYNTTTLVPLDYMEGTAKYYINCVLQPVVRTDSLLLHIRSLHCRLPVL